MYLKRIELQGFKSFAEKTVIEARGGITAIVGPNGSGKSNIADAVRWVMGEQSAKALRGGKMEDVIFNGTEKRRPLGYAEVSMVFDNSAGFLPSEYAEVEITRRVFRSGESEYLINREPCRLRDIHELFMDTGMGRDGYSIIGQGKIAEIVSQKGEERRSVFEEAAGVSKYRYRKEEAERKLAHTEDNLIRVKDILTELEGRVWPLEKQSEKAVKFLNLREELKGIEVSALLDLMDAKKRQLSEAEQSCADASARLEEAKRRCADATRENEELFARSREADNALEAARAALSEAEAAAAELTNSALITENNIKNADENRKRLEYEIENHEKQTAAVRGELAAAEADERSAVEALAGLNASLAELEAALREAVGKVAEKSGALEAARARVAELERVKAEAKTKIESMDFLEESFGSRAEALAAEAAEADAGLTRRREELVALEAETEECEKERAAAADALREKTAAEAEAARLIEQKKDECNALVSAVGEKRARLNMLKDMERHLEGYARSVRDLVNDKCSGRYRGSFVGVLSKLVNTDGKYVTAVEVALGGAMQNIVVETEADAKEAIEYLKKNKLGRVTFLPISTQRGRRLEDEARLLGEKGAVAVAADLVRRESRLDSVVEALLGRTLVVDGIDNAVRIANENKYRFKIVTLAGELLQPGGSITGGSVNKSQALLRRGEEIAALEKECAALEKRSDAAEDEIDRLADALDERRSEAERARDALSEAEANLSRARAEADMKRGLVEMAEERIVKLDAERAELESRRRGAAESRGEAGEALNDADGLTAAAEASVERAKDELAAAEAARDDALDAVTAKRVETAAAEKDIDVIRGREDELRARIDGSAEIYADKLRRRSEAEGEAAALRDELASFAAASEERAKAVARLRAEAEARLEEKTGSAVRLEDISKKIRELNDEAYVLQEEAIRLETKKSRLEADFESASARLWDDYELTYNTALPFRKDVGSVTAAQKRVSELKNRIKALGPVNVGAIDEYKEVRQRYDFLNTQLADLEEAKRSLEKLIGEMLSVMRERFSERFKLINESFGKIFAELFGGGRASVSLSDPSDVLASSIEIEVQPPGKKLQSISLLSGGEHALTAIALLFALLKASPSPFIMLDEIEAALDDENVYRFADYLKSYDDTTQFIVITHRRGTMEAANLLYGVTMQEKGVSRLLSMSLEDVENN